MSSTDVDRVVREGSRIYSAIAKATYLLITDIPGVVRVWDDDFSVTAQDMPLAGSLGREISNEMALTFDLTDALKRGVESSQLGFFTIGDNPGYTTAIQACSDRTYLCFDSHNRNDKGECAADGTAVLLSVSSLDNMVLYIKRLAKSLGYGGDTPFEVSPVKVGITTQKQSSVEATDMCPTPAPKKRCMSHVSSVDTTTVDQTDTRSSGNISGPTSVLSSVDTTTVDQTDTRSSGNISGPTSVLSSVDTTTVDQTDTRSSGNLYGTTSVLSSVDTTTVDQTDTRSSGNLSGPTSVSNSVDTTTVDQTESTDIGTYTNSSGNLATSISDH